VGSSNSLGSDAFALVFRTSGFQTLLLIPSFPLPSYATNFSLLR
jgi:hypothetical protein